MKETYFLVLGLERASSAHSAGHLLLIPYRPAIQSFPGVIQDANHPGGCRCLEQQFLHCRMSKNDEDAVVIWGTLSEELKIWMFTSHQVALV